MNRLTIRRVARNSEQKAASSEQNFSYCSLLTASSRNKLFLHPVRH